VTKAISGVELADQNALMILDNWEKRTPHEITASLLAISSALSLAEHEMSNLEGYLRYHDTSSTGGSTMFLSRLFQFYQQAADAKLRGTMQYINLPAAEIVTEMSSLRRDIESLQKDLHHLSKLDKTIFERGNLTEIREYWFKEISNLQDTEVLRRYEETEGNNLSK